MYIKIIICLHTNRSREPCIEEDVNIMSSVKKSNATYFLHIGVTVVQYNSCQGEMMCAGVKDMCNS